MMKSGLYKGISFAQFGYNKSFKLLDYDLVKENLTKHIFTRRGERVNMTQFGTRIPDILFEPLDDNTLDIIESDIIDVINFDPRIRLLDLKVIPNFEENSVRVTATINYIELNLNDILDLKLDFEK